MHKANLQEACRQRRWPPPEYTITRVGSDHDPRFRASVAVDGLSFDGGDFCKSLKEAQSRASIAALDHLAAASAASVAVVNPPPSDTTHQALNEGQISYKSQLQNLVQKRTKDIPTYECVREGPPHALRFKAIVKVDGLSFESPEYFSTLREAEHAAAKVALSSMPLSPEENKQDESGFYKNLLQELAQKEGFLLPVYKTIKEGAPHLSIFFSTVEIEGRSFEGEKARNKKQAEINAAKVAWYKLKEHRAKKATTGLSSRFPVQRDHEATFKSSQSAVNNLHQPTQPSVEVSCLRIYTGKEDVSDKAQLKENSPTEIAVKFDFSHTNRCPSVDQETKPTIEITGKNDSSAPASVQKLESEVSEKKVHDVESISTASESSSISVPPNSLAEFTEPSIGEAPTSSLCSRITVYPRKPKMQLPEGTSLLPFSDNMWIAVSLDFSNNEGGVSVS